MRGGARPRGYGPDAVRQVFLAEGAGPDFAEKHVAWTSLVLLRAQPPDRYAQC